MIVKETVTITKLNMARLWGDCLKNVVANPFAYAGLEGSQYRFVAPKIR